MEGITDLFYSNSAMDTGNITSLIVSVIEILKEEGVLSSKDAAPVVLFRQPEDLKKELNLALEGTFTEAELLSTCRKIARYSVKTSHPFFVNQLYGGVDMYGFVGTIISESLNTNQYTYEVAPAFSLCESIVIRKTLEKFGFEHGDGIFAPGGSMSNMYGVVLARFFKFPEVKSSGMFGMAPLVVFTSQDSHYSIKKCAHWLGFGTDNVVSVETDNCGRMLPDKLEESIQSVSKQGKVPFFVNATAGTTVLGAFDKLNDIANICQQHKLWLHVDACWGGSLIFSNIYKMRLDGIHRADSVSWNPHKMLGAPLQCSLFLTRHEELLKECNKAGASYLFQQDKMYDVAYDSGDKSVQCGRKVDAFKLWCFWKVRGCDGIGILVDNALDRSRYFLNQIKNRPDFLLVLDNFETSNICFWYIPLRLRGKDKTDDWWNEVDNVAPKLKKILVQESCLMIGYQPLSHKRFVNFFRLVVTCHPPRTDSHMDDIIKMLIKYGKDL